jgi:hypothetical protein
MRCHFGWPRPLPSNNRTFSEFDFFHRLIRRFRSHHRVWLATKYGCDRSVAATLWQCEEMNSIAVLLSGRNICRSCAAPTVSQHSLQKNFYYVPTKIIIYFTARSLRRITTFLGREKIGHWTSQNKWTAKRNEICEVQVSCCLTSWGVIWSSSVWVLNSRMSIVKIDKNITTVFEYNYFMLHYRLSQRHLKIDILSVLTQQILIFFSRL